MLHKWFEIWYSDGVDVLPTYLLMVTVEPLSKNIVGIDPLKSNAVVFRAAKYEEVCSWLSEDEYDLVDGRQFPDDGW